MTEEDYQMDEDGVSAPVQFVDENGDPTTEDGDMYSAVDDEVIDDTLPADDEVPADELHDEPELSAEALKIAKLEGYIERQDRAIDKLTGVDGVQAPQATAAPDPLALMTESLVAQGYKQDDAEALTKAFAPMYAAQQETMTQVQGDLQRALSMSANVSMNHEQARNEAAIKATNPDVDIAAVTKLVNTNVQDQAMAGLSWEQHYELAEARVMKQQRQAKARKVDTQQKNKLAGRERADTGTTRHQQVRKVATPPKHLSGSDRLSWILDN